jgi:uncharacterized tellurite resistance protein B-like protein
MPGLAPVELTADCGGCGLESGSVETYDALVPACRFGLPATTRCKLCGSEHEGTLDRPPAKPLREIPANRCPACLGELDPRAIDDHACGRCGARAAVIATHAGTRFGSLADFERALDAWAERESFPGRKELVQATFANPSIEELFACLTRGDRLEVIADPFANMGVRTTGRPTSSPASKPKPDPKPPSALPPTKPSSTGTEPMARPLPLPVNVDVDVDVDVHVHVHEKALTRTHEELRPPPSAPPRAILYPLVSVIAADGEIHPAERALVDQFLRSEGLPPLADEEIRVHHPTEIAHLVSPARREDVVKLMCESAAADGMPDESERRVIRAYAHAWGVDDEKVDFWMWGYETMNTSLARGLFLKIRRFVLSARWSDPEDTGGDS